MANKRCRTCRGNSLFSTSLWLVLAATACGSPQTALLCIYDVDCGAPSGRCIPILGEYAQPLPPNTPQYGYCAHPSSDCASGLKYDTTAGQLAGRCVDIPDGSQ